ncbi:DNA methyltransferase [Thioflexithrix psekupsensis]|uniref:DNA methylase n=1 Tax=Thioflexithrix psekupsensis TaxID=1570016 RepID=A0A251XAI9_9GAMM|nr:DNA methyltransferase [Thioflexithrix psekupsensis]OUD15323.1 DNA methylase [Thioflexithrix psekupsensis]
MLFNDFDFSQLDSPDFKEDSVRETLILPLLTALGYQQENIVRSKMLQHPFLKTGSKKRPITLIPDYLLKIENAYAWVLEAKSPSENILMGDAVEQVYSYSIHPEVRSKFFALCNGRSFSLFRSDEISPLLYFDLAEIADYWETLQGYLSIHSFQMGKVFSYLPLKTNFHAQPFDYLNRPLLEEIDVKKRAARRHFGVHGYFTKQAWNVVNRYIQNFSQKGDLVLDPFGGSGVTAIEAMMLERRAIHLDLNPMSAFLVDSLIRPVKLEDLQASFERIKAAYESALPISVKQALKKYPYPKDFSLPKGSDVRFIQDLFSPEQLAQLAFLKNLILQEKNLDIRKALLLAFSSSINKSNLTYHHSTYASKNAGDSGPMRYYRYRIAPRPVSLDLMKTYEKKFSSMLNAKREIEPRINEQTVDNLQIIRGTATDLSFLKKESVDYIYTDPPYGKKIPYLDLSVMWNAWLDLPVSEEDYALEAIEGGEHEKTKDQYNSLMAKSIEEMYRVLKFDRWMSFVFAHKDPEFWHLIIDTAERCGFEYAGAVAQKNGQTSFKKRQNPFTVLSGQLIINFKKVRRPKYIMRASLGMEIGDVVMQTIEGIIAKNNGATLEQINDELIIKGLELGFLDLLKKEYSDLTPFLLETFDYHSETELFTIKQDGRFKTYVDLNLRVRYYLISYLRRMERENKTAYFDQIVLHIMPLLKNGNTPEEQTILNVLEQIAFPVGDGWKLKVEGQAGLF